MNMFDEARSLLGMMRMCRITQGELAKKLGVSQSYIANKLRLLKFTPEMQEKISRAGLTERHARALLRLEDKPQRLEEAFDAVTRRALNVEKTEALVDFLHDGTAPERIGRAELHSRIDTFKDTLKASIESLVRLGIEAKQSTDFYGTKTYITICIDEA